MIAAPAITLRAINAAVQAGFVPLKPRPPLTLSEWADEHFMLSPESSHQHGRWRAYPFQRGWMDAFSNDAITEVTVRKSKRVGYTKTLLALIAYNAAHARRKQALWQPTDDDRDAFVKTEIDPMLRDVVAMKPVMLSRREDTLKLKQFVGSVLHMLGGKAARAYRRITVSTAMLDEASAFDRMVENALDPVEGARGRLEGAAFPKLIVGSTPRTKGMDHVETREANADVVMRYHVVCPHCNVDHPLEFGGEKVQHGFKWDGHDADSVRHVCPHCREPITQAQYLQAWDAADSGWVSKCGEWRYGHDRLWRRADGAVCEPPKHVAFFVWAAYSPQRSWADIVREFLQAKAKAKTGELGPLVTFINETLGELWEAEQERADEHALSRRAEDYRRFTVPLGGLVLVAGVDVQDDRFEVVTWAVGRGEEMWCVDYSVIYANPADEREWGEKLDPYLDKEFQHACGTTLKISAAAVDTGGHFTHQAYNFCRMRRRVFAVKGDAQPGKPVKQRAEPKDVNWQGKIIRRGVRLWMVGTDTAKDLLFGRLRVKEPGPGYVHFSKDLPSEFYAQLTSEARVPQRTAKGVVFRWTQTTPARNEVLDCTVYALFAVHVLGLHLRNDAEWARLEGQVQPDAPAIRTAHSPPPAPVAPTPSAPALHAAQPQPWRPVARPLTGLARAW
jgi:phage terminase large subunit GpA-like protein